MVEGWSGLAVATDPSLGEVPVRTEFGGDMVGVTGLASLSCLLSFFLEIWIVLPGLMRRRTVTLSGAAENAFLRLGVGVSQRKGAWMGSGGKGFAGGGHRGGCVVRDFVPRAVPARTVLVCPAPPWLLLPSGQHSSTSSSRMRKRFRISKVSLLAPCGPGSWGLVLVELLDGSVGESVREYAGGSPPVVASVNEVKGPGDAA